MAELCLRCVLQKDSEIWLCPVSIALNTSNTTNPHWCRDARNRRRQSHGLCPKSQHRSCDVPALLRSTLHKKWSHSTITSWSCADTKNPCDSKASREKPMAAAARSLITHPSMKVLKNRPTTRTRHQCIGAPLATSDPKFTRGAARRRFTYTVQLQRTGAISRCKYAMVGSRRWTCGSASHEDVRLSPLGDSAILWVVWGLHRCGCVAGAAD